MPLGRGQASNQMFVTKDQVTIFYSLWLHPKQVLSLVKYLSVPNSHQLQLTGSEEI